MKKEEGLDSPKKIRLNIKKIFFLNRAINIISATVFFVTIVTQLFKVKIHIGETALFYFFSSIAQSMAAIIALAGTVAIFRYSFLTDRLKDSRTFLKEKIGDQWVSDAVGLSSETRYWSDEKLMCNANDCLKSGNLASSTKEEIAKGFSVFESYRSRTNSFVSHLQPLFISSFATFILSVFLIPFSSRMARLAVGIYFWELFTFLVVITSFNLYDYFVSTATLGKGA